MVMLQLAYLANCLVAGWVGLSCLFSPNKAVQTVFSNTVAPSQVIRLVGALWTAIFILSFVGLFYPDAMVAVLVFQVLYKGVWLLIVALPAIRNARDYPKAMAVFFLVWVAWLPRIIPWQGLFQ